MREDHRTRLGTLGQWGATVQRIVAQHLPQNHPDTELLMDLMLRSREREIYLDAKLHATAPAGVVHPDGLSPDIGDLVEPTELIEE